MALTCGIFYCRVGAEINGCGSLQTLSRLDSAVLRNRQQKHTDVRWRSCKKRNKLLTQGCHLTNIFLDFNKFKGQKNET